MLKRMLYSKQRMLVVFVLARDWTMRTAVRAELRERGIEALGMDSPDDAGRALARGQFPSAVVLEGTSEFASHAAIQNLTARVPTVWIASRTEKIPEPTARPTHGDAPRQHTGVVLYRPVRIDEIVSSVLDLLRHGQAA
jgi:hypothetical protein